MAYQNYAGAWLTQSDGAYDWLATQWSPVNLSPGIDTVKLWQSYTLGNDANNLIVFGDHNYAAGNDQANVIKVIGSGDMIYGGRGSDVFVGSGGSATTFIVAQGEGDKVIQNFTEGADTVRLIGGPLTTVGGVQAAMTQQGPDVVLNDGGTMIAFRNATVGQFHAQDFQLPLNYATLGTPTFGDDFNSSSTIGSTWATNYGFGGAGLGSFTLPGNGEQQIYTSSSFQGTSGAPLGLNPYSLNNGVLTISAQPVSADQSSKMWGYHYSSGVLVSNFTQTYGYFEMRAELPHGQGLWPAFWLLGENQKEIDVLEGLGSDTKVANNAIHTPSVPAVGNASYNPYPDGFHTYGVLWDPQHITYYVDGSPVWATATPADMNSPMRMIVNLAVGGNWPGSPDASTPFPAQMKIDYVRAYNLPSAASTGGGGSAGGTPGAGVPPPPAPTGGGSTGGTAGAGIAITADDNYPKALMGGAGADTLTEAHLSDNLTGGGGADTFVFKYLPWNAGHILDFQVGLDKIDLSALLTASGYSGSNPVADGYVSFVSNGAGGTKVMFDSDGPGQANTWPSVVTNLEGVAPGGLTAANVLGSTGSTSAPPPTAPPAGTGLVLTSVIEGDHLVGGAGADTLNAGQGHDILTGGGGGDSFVFRALPWNAGHITDFQAGVDKIDISALYTNGYHGANPVADGYVTLVSDGAGGTKVLLDVDGPGPSGLRYQITTLDGVSPGTLSGASMFGTQAGGSSPGVTLTSYTPGGTLTGGAGNDTLIAGPGPDVLIGGAGADHMVFSQLPWNAGHVSDFTPGVDVLDLRGLFAASGYTGVDPIADGYLSFVSNGSGGTKVMFDQDGRGSGHPWPTTITTLDNVTPSSIHSADWLMH